MLHTWYTETVLDAEIFCLSVCCFNKVNEYETRLSSSTVTTKCWVSTYKMEENTLINAALPIFYNLWEQISSEADFKC